MKYSYFPGCTLKNKARELDIYARKSAELLGAELEELSAWQCCGGVYPTNKDKIATRLSSARALIAARDNNQKLVTLCSACHNVIKQVNNDIATDEKIRTAINNYMDTDYNGETTVIHFLELLRDHIGFDTIRSKVVKPFTNVKIGAFYGCLLLRPSRVMAMDLVDNPKILEDFIRAIGGEPVIYALRNECCSGYLTMEDKTAAQNQARKIIQNAKNCGADMLITACPLCLYNLKNQDLPIKYFTELLAEALGLN